MGQGIPGHVAGDIVPFIYEQNLDPKTIHSAVFLTMDAVEPYWAPQNAVCAPSFLSRALMVKLTADPVAAGVLLARTLGIATGMAEDATAAQGTCTSSCVSDAATVMNAFSASIEYHGWSCCSNAAFIENQFTNQNCLAEIGMLSLCMNIS